jgi:GNAT superfamily N-acetyltransferase
MGLCRTGSGFFCRRTGFAARQKEAAMDVRPFARRDREQLARLVNAHVAVVLPGAYVPPATMLNDLEHPLGEFVIGPWVTELATFVAIERDRVVAAAHLRRYGDDGRVSASYRNVGEIVWLLCWPDQTDAGRAVLDAATAHLVSWGVRQHYGNGTLPCPAVYGVSDGWPHVRALYEAAAFDAGDAQVEVVFAGATAGVAPPGPAPVPGLSLRRRLGTLGTAFDAVLAGEAVGMFEVDDDLTRGGTNLGAAGWADVCNHRVREDLRGHGIGTWLVRSAVEWLRLGGTSRLLAYAVEDDRLPDWIRYYGRFGLHPVNRTTRGFERTPGRN